MPYRVPMVLPIILVAAVLPSATGCSYLGRRALDLGDAVYLHAGIGLGLEAHAGVMPGIGQMGFGGHVSRRVGLDGWQRGRWKERQLVVALPFLLGLFGVDRPEHSEGMCRVPGFSGCIPFGWGNRFVIGPEAGAFMGLVGMEGGVDVLQFADFVLGWAGIDYMGDDVIDVDGVLSQEWSGFFPCSGRSFCGAVWQMTDVQLMQFLPRTHGEARLSVYQELARRRVQEALGLMVDHFEFAWFNTNEFDLALEAVESLVQDLAPEDPLRQRVNDLRGLPYVQPVPGGKTSGAEMLGSAPQG